ncbi:hypothetical protein DFJ73DRAFT_65928 [Zopfochytrium polystomum]|nr:hypothetical protein DFJ73DRAFT_65928 [Zopfochytrium polystomum]
MKAPPGRLGETGGRARIILRARHFSGDAVLWRGISCILCLFSSASSPLCSGVCSVFSRYFFFLSPCFSVMSQRLTGAKDIKTAKWLCRGSCSIVVPSRVFLVFLSVWCFGSAVGPIPLLHLQQKKPRIPSPTNPGTDWQRGNIEMTSAGQEL